MKILKISVFFILIGVLSSCVIRLIAPYDAITDEKVSNLQEQVAVKFIEWERKTPPFNQETKFYDHTEAVLEILILRNQQIKKADTLIKMLQKIQENIKIMKELHIEDQLSKEVIQQIKPDIMAQFIAIQNFQMALKNAKEK